MKKTKLIIMPLVMFMAACNKQAPAGFSTRVDLPAGGTEVTPTEDSKGAYESDLQLFVNGIFNSLNHDAIKLSINVDANVKDIPVGDNQTTNATAKLDLDAYVTMPTSESYATAFIDLKDLTLSVANVPNVGNVGINGLKLKAYYRVEADGAKIYGDLSDPSVKENVVPVIQTVVDSFMAASTPGVNVDVGVMYDQLLGNGKVVYTLPEFKIQVSEEQEDRKSVV